MKTFFMVRGQFTYEEAVQRICAAHGGQMATSRSIEEFNFIPDGVGLQIGERAWINLKRVSSGSSDFQWMFNPMVDDLKKFLEGAQFRSGNCVGLERRSQSIFGWQVFECDFSMSIICETFTML